MNERRYPCKDGVAARVDAYQINSTYARVILSRHSIESNQFLLDHFQQGLEKCWGKRPTLILWSHDMQRPNSVKLPPWTCALWASSQYAPTSGDDLSELVVIWFEQSPEHQSIEALAAQALARVEWRVHARGCQY